VARFFKNLAVVISLAVVYFVAGKLGLTLAFVHPSATPVWPPTGIAFAAFLLLGYQVWPGIFLGAFLVNVTTAGTVATSIGIAAGNTLEGLLGAYLVNRFASGRNVFDRAQDIFKFTVLAGMVSTMVSATLGVTSLALDGFADWANYGSIWLTWWLGDMAGDLIVAPLLILWSVDPRVRWTRRQFFEAVLLLLSLALLGQAVFGGLSTGTQDYPLEFMSIPFLVWAAFRFSQREAATCIFLLSWIAIWNTLRGFGPFVRESPNESLLLLQAFMGVVAVMVLAMAAVVSEQKRLDKERIRLCYHEEIARLEANAKQQQVVNILDSITEVFLVIDKNWRITYLNREAERFLRRIQKTRSGLIGRKLGEEFPYSKESNFYLGFLRAMDEQVLVEFEEFYPPVSAWFEVRAYPSTGGLSVYLRDVTARKQAEEEALRLVAIVESSDDAIISKTLDGIIQSWNAGAEKLYGYSANEIIGRPVSILIPEDRPNEMSGMLEKLRRGERIEHFETVRVRKNGTSIDVSLTVSPVMDASGKIIGASTIARDITERKAYTAALQYLAFHDSLTNLPNRALFYDRLQQAIRSVQRANGTVAVLTLDLDHFKEINDDLGHDYGDLLLKMIRPRLQGALRESDTIARLGGDEFAVLLPSVDINGAKITARKILNGLKQPFVLEGITCVIGVSIGIALFPMHGTDVKTLMQHSDIAMYMAKKSGHGYAVYDNEQKGTEPVSPDRQP